MPKTAARSSLRAKAIRRAKGYCEYCRQPDDRDLNAYSHEVDHVISRKHSGKTALDNLAYACFDCNRHKGSDIASIDPQTGELTYLFNPRRQEWYDHFRYDETGVLFPLTAVGRTTAALLRLNAPIRVQARADLIANGKMILAPE